MFNTKTSVTPPIQTFIQSRLAAAKYAIWLEPETEVDPGHVWHRIRDQ